ncbi:TrkH family potassium uptake protein [Ruegeria pomeroyi]|uniref:Trk system potassium uptake protein TrkH n=2 Tax=Ruegeria pomeroyi TaxID=89184 RepID=Q5LRP3_RUEPO|nr:potassium transporter TrkG [Ruegeria pomeroyi]AAV95353.1 Trk system potassium uptake protein TrkH [Ruegeria pomeroyi DSS-3]NVK96943.1 TrkH family potassium uptake protein [Ruegeria pomeroyi]NVL02366.1 TrkH family potassium uptake protein [Ruegeria pomeroyi]QWV08920.1 TrkH family potassium uptake protein [Ruegeria pomeroyi]
MVRRRQTSETGLLRQLPLALLIWGLFSLMMWVPAVYALTLNDHPTSRSFFYAGILGLVVVTTISLARAGRPSRHGLLGQLAVLLSTFAVLPLFLAVPFHDALKTTSFLNAYFEMVSAITTTGAEMFPDPGRLSAPLHLWRAQVGWLGGLVMWIAASAILAPLSLGGFEVTAQGQPGRVLVGQGESVDPRGRLLRVAATLAPVYAGLTLVVAILLLAAGDSGLVAICHAMSVMATSGISPVGGLSGGASGLTGEAILFLFMFFALSRLTFSSDTAMRGHARLDQDPEFRIGLLILLGVPALLFLRHWSGAIDIASGENLTLALRALWGSLFTVMSFLSTTGFESTDWAEARQWSGLGTPGMILLGLSVIGGGVATTAGGVKLLRVYALYLNGTRELQRLVHPSSVSSATGRNRRIQRGGAFIAWVFFMLFAISLAAIALALAAAGSDFETAMVLSIATLSTTGPLIEIGAQEPIRLIEMPAAAKLILSGAMIIGRLETLAFIALITPALWRN